MYRAMKEKNPGNRTRSSSAMAARRLGRGDGDTLGHIDFGSKRRHRFRSNRAAFPFLS
jgi:hypothetical protein